MMDEGWSGIPASAEPREAVISVRLKRSELAQIQSLGAECDRRQADMIRWLIQGRLPGQDRRCSVTIRGRSAPRSGALVARRHRDGRESSRHG